MIAARMFFGLAGTIYSENLLTHSLNNGSEGMNGAQLFVNLSRMGTDQSKS